MYRHILIPTDGSRLAAKGIKAGLRLAKALGARVTGVHVVPRNPPPVYAVEGVVFVPELTPAVFAQTVKKEAAKILSVLAGQARAAQVRCSTETPADNQPWLGMLRVARARKCDVIVMASHGRGNLGGLILGSQATRVLAHSKLPVLVVR